MNSIDGKIFRDLYKATEGLMVFTLHTRYLMTPAQIYKFTIKYEKLKYIEVSDTKLEITKEGRKFVIESGFEKEDIDLFGKIPFQFVVQNKIEINEFYVPIRSKLDKKKFENLFKEKER